MVVVLCHVSPIVENGVRNPTRIDKP